MRIACFSAKDYDYKYFGEDHLVVQHELTFFTAQLTEQTAAFATGFDAVCIFVDDNASRSVLQVLRNGGVKLILLRCTGSNKLDQVAAAELDIAIRFVPSYSPFAVAEHTVAMMLCLNRKLHKAYSRVREGNFSLDGLLGFDMHDKTIGIIGTGQVGALVAKALKLGFGCKVVAFDTNPSDRLKHMGVSYCSSLDELFAMSNIISLHVPLSSTTRHLINSDALVRMKQGTMLINTSHGALVDTRAVIEALKTKKLGAVGFDVYEEEVNIFYEDMSNQPIQDDTLARLLTFPNVLITAHQAFFTAACLKQIAHATLQNATQFSSVTTK